MGISHPFPAQALKNALAATGRDFLVALHSDNGGFPCAQYLCSSNYPLRGAKFDFMEGALRVPATFPGTAQLDDAVARGAVVAAYCGDACAHPPGPVA